MVDLCSMWEYEAEFVMGEIYRERPIHPENVREISTRQEGLNVFERSNLK